MAFHLPLQQMNISEKLQAMEMLWEDLQHRHDAVQSPQWHHDLLESREAQVKDGTMAFEDWSKVKGHLFNELKSPCVWVVADCRKNPISLKKKLT